MVINYTSNSSKLTRYLSMLAIALAVQFAASPADAHDPDVSLSGFGMATIDGVLSPGEWDSAGSINFDVNVPEGGTTPGTLFVMNSATNLYLAVRFTRTAADPGNTAVFEFDNDHGGDPRANGDDALSRSDRRKTNKRLLIGRAAQTKGEE